MTKNPGFPEYTTYAKFSWPYRPQVKLSIFIGVHLWLKSLQPSFDKLRTGSSKKGESFAPAVTGCRVDK